MNTILITDGTVFVGANIAINFNLEHPKAKIICLDNLKSRGSELNIAILKQYNIEFIHSVGDHIWSINDISKFKMYYPDWNWSYNLEQTLYEMYSSLTNRD